MSEQNAHEPTMEEILASIRRIISEDDVPAEQAADSKPAAEPVKAEDPVEDISFDAPDMDEPVADMEPEPEPEPEEDVLELTEDFVAAKPSFDAIGDIEAYSPAPAAAAPVIAPEPVFTREPVMEERLVSERTVETAAAAFSQLSNAVLMPRDARTIEDVLKDLMRPMLQDWLDRNLPVIVEEQVRIEVERIARRGQR